MAVPYVALPARLPPGRLNTDSTATMTPAAPTAHIIALHLYPKNSNDALTERVEPSPECIPPSIPFADDRLLTPRLGDGLPACTTRCVTYAVSSASPLMKRAMPPHARTPKAEMQRPWFALMTRFAFLSGIPHDADSPPATSRPSPTQTGESAFGLL